MHYQNLGRGEGLRRHAENLKVREGHLKQTRNYNQEENKSVCSMKTKCTVESGDKKFGDNISNVCNIFTVFVSPLFVCMLFVIIQNLGSFNSR